MWKIYNLQNLLRWKFWYFVPVLWVVGIASNLCWISPPKIEFSKRIQYTYCQDILISLIYISFTYIFNQICILQRCSYGWVRRGGRASAPSELGRSVNPIQTGGHIMPLTLLSALLPDSKNYLHLCTMSHNSWWTLIFNVELIASIMNIKKINALTRNNEYKRKLNALTR